MANKKKALVRLDRWSKYWCLPFNPSKCEASFFSVDPHQTNLQTHLFLLNSTLRFNSIPTFLAVTFDRTLSFWKHVSSLKAKFFPRLKASRCISASWWAPQRSSSLFCIRLFFNLFSHILHPDGSLFSALPNWNAFTERLVAPSPAASHPPLSHFFSLRFFYLPQDSFLPVILWVGPSSPKLFFHFRFGQTWSEIKTLQVLVESFCVHLTAHAFSWEDSSCLLFFSSLGPSFLYCGVYSFLPMLLLRSPSLSPRCGSRSPWLFPISRSGDLGKMALFLLAKGDSGVFANCSFCGTDVIFSFSAGPVCSSFSAEACAFFQALYCFRKHQQL